MLQKKRKTKVVSGEINTPAVVEWETAPQLPSSTTVPKPHSSKGFTVHNCTLKQASQFHSSRVGDKPSKHFPWRRLVWQEKTGSDALFHVQIHKYKNPNTNVQLACLARKTGSDQAFPTIAHQQPISIASFAPIFAHFCSQPWGKTALTSSFNPALLQKVHRR